MQAVSSKRHMAFRFLHSCESDISSFLIEINIAVNAVVVRSR